MRDIKFRAWNGQHWFKEFSLSNDGQTIYETGDRYNTWDEVTLSQYTELRDSKGKEIYEGDIVEWDYDFGDEVTKISHNRAEVYFSHGSFNLTKSVFNLAKAKGTAERGTFLVVGNIYENPELPNSEPGVQASVARNDEQNGAAD